ncbi:hypothetical protein [Corynebacterium jeikeium]|uniref:hypothetical protein n=1 Tax=Corynebacterium jeikeium TaxID=38289 RepID=UPI00088E5A2B|nr:hypothetical protein [Corynebacterium jeikeium]SCX05970.1 hypothetical protein CJBVI_0448 [Corynebacterium jeikeium]
MIGLDGWHRCRPSVTVGASYTYERDGQTIAGEEFVAKKIGHDTARTRYDVDRTPRHAINRDVARQAFDPPEHQQTAPAADSFSMCPGEHRS